MLSYPIHLISRTAFSLPMRISDSMGVIIQTHVRVGCAIKRGGWSLNVCDDNFNLFEETIQMPEPSVRMARIKRTNSQGVNEGVNNDARSTSSR